MDSADFVDAKIEILLSSLFFLLVVSNVKDTAAKIEEMARTDQKKTRRDQPRSRKQTNEGYLH
jgi:hypothetical protein